MHDSYFYHFYERYCTIAMEFHRKKMAARWKIGATNLNINLICAGSGAFVRGVKARDGGYTPSRWAPERPTPQK